MKVLTPAFANAKTAKSIKFDDYLSSILHLAPSDVSGVINTCPWASAGCKAACLNTAGRGRFDSIQQARINKTKRLVNDRESFFEDLYKDHMSLSRKAAKLGKNPVSRLNGTSDLPWHHFKIKDNKTIFQLFPHIQFYDYTKDIKRLRMLHENPISNYNVTFSASESNWDQCVEALKLGFNVAVVFDSIPEKYLGYEVINGDDHDLRFLDKQGGVIVGLKAKGKAKKDLSGFVKRGA